MKNILLSFSFVFLGITAISAQEISFDKEVIDYGQVMQGSDGVRSFLVKNTGDKPLVIKKVSSSCGCTVPEKPEKPILPGKTGEIKVKYNTEHSGKFSKSITVFSNDEKSARKILRIRGEVLSK